MWIHNAGRGGVVAGEKTGNEREKAKRKPSQVHLSAAATRPFGWTRKKNPGASQHNQGLSKFSFALDKHGEWD